MKIIVSPAKKMRSEVDGVDARSIPVFLEQSRQLADHLKTLSLEELRRLLGCNDALARLNYERYQRMDLDQKGEPALLSYEGIISIWHRPCLKMHSLRMRKSICASFPVFTAC